MVSSSTPNSADFKVFNAVQDVHFFNLYRFHDVLVGETKSGRGWGAITLPGIGIFTDNYKDKYKLMHEYGHILQSQAVGVGAFYKYYGAPSLYNTIENSYEERTYGREYYSVPHDYFRTETDANSRAANYFGSKFTTDNIQYLRADLEQTKYSLYTAQ